MNHRPRLWLFLFLFALAPMSALANWPNSPGLGLPIATGPDAQQCLGICTDGSGGSIVLIRAPAMTAQRIDRLGRPVWAPEGVWLSYVGGAIGTHGASIASDDAGGAFAAWVVSASYYRLYTKLRFQRIRADGSLLTTFGTDLAGTDGTSYESPGLVRDGQGGVILAWLGPNSANMQAEIYAQRFDPDGVTLWSEPKKVSETQAWRKDPVYTSDGAGGIVIAWREIVETPTYHTAQILAQRLGPNGAPLWGSSAVVISTTGFLYGSLAVGNDGRGGFVVTWPDARGAASTQGTAYAQRLDLSGAASWSPGGMPVATTPTESAVGVVADAQGGVYVGMFRREPDFDLFVQHLDANGSALWDPVGVRVGAQKIGSYGPLGRFQLQMVSDAASGTVVSWSENVEPVSAGETDCRAQRFNPAGKLLWGSDGAPVSMASASQYSPQMIPDGKGGATLAWTHGSLYTTIGSDVYGQHINSQGKVGTPATPIASATPIETRLSLQSIRPNPMSEQSTIEFSIPVSSRVRVSVLDVSGHRVRVLFEGMLEAGVHEMPFDGRSVRGTRLPAGLYFVSVEDGHERQTRRIVVY